MRIRVAAEAFITDRQYKGLASKSLAAYEWALSKLPQGEWPMERAELRRVIGDERLGDTSRTTLYRHLRVFSRWCAREYDVADPISDLDSPLVRPTPRRVLSQDEVKRLLTVSSTRRDRALIAVALDTGLRLGELTSMNWQTISTDCIGVNGKTGPRVVPISPQVRGLLDGLGDQHHVWTGDRGPLSYWGVCGAIRRLMRRADISPPGAGAHTLRHTFATMFIAAGGPVFALQRIMGHCSVTTTQVYVSMSISDIAAHHAKYGPISQIGEISEIRTKDL